MSENKEITSIRPIRKGAPPGYTVRYVQTAAGQTVKIHSKADQQPRPR